MTEDKPEEKGTWIGLGLSAVMLVVSFIACGITGIAASEMREEEAVTLSYLTIPFIVAGLVAWLPAALTRKKGTALAVGAPLGCGCLAGIAASIGLMIFYVVLWPSL
jgi:hypothetical protein